MGSDQSRTFLAVILSGFILIAWNYFFQNKNLPQQSGHPQLEKMQGMQEGGTNGKKQINSVSTGTMKSFQQAEKEPLEKLNVEVKTYELFRKNHYYRFNSHFEILGIKSDLSTEEFSFVTGTSSPFSMLFTREERERHKPFFEIRQVSNSKLEGVDSKLGIFLKTEILENGKLHVKMNFKHPIKPRLIFQSQKFGSEKGEASGGGISLLPVSGGDYKQTRRFLLLGQELDEVLVGDEETGDLQLKWFGIDSNYHLFAFILSEKKSLHYKSETTGKLIVDFNKELDNIEWNFIYAKKYYNNLKVLGESLDRGIDFGIFSLIAIPLFKALQFLYNAIPNWGVAIILLTLFIRLLTFPLYYKQMKSMNKMKKIQPQLQKMKEKYKGDTRRQQVETMALFKREGVNPIGGCLPLILQMPIFIAFYKVLTVSAELDNSPFVGWITSLTEKDPYYLLPVAVTFLMWFNQKVMPQTSIDPTQQKIMSFMPLIFGFIFLNMPSGLNLYILVSTGFGIAQQLFVNKQME